MVTKPGDISYSLSPRFGGRGGQNDRMQIPNRTVLPKSPFRKGGLKNVVPTFNWLRKPRCSLRPVLQ
jgi:hypothetical protein